MHSRPVCCSNAEGGIFYGQTLIFRKLQFSCCIVIDFRIRLAPFKLSAGDNFFKIMMNVIFCQNPVDDRKTGGGGKSQAKAHSLKPVEDAGNFFPEDAPVVHLCIDVYRGAEFIPQLLPGLTVADSAGHAAPCIFPGGAYHAEQIF